MNKFTLFWSDGKRQVVEGKDLADACLRAGIQVGAFVALAFFLTGEDYSYEWKDKKWQKK
ncbi:MAG: hypothetical protein WCT18_00695 [Patescibacteria group bacterium]